jgi:hypothetical protein
VDNTSAHIQQKKSEKKFKRILELNRIGEIR